MRRLKTLPPVTMDPSDRVNIDRGCYWLKLKPSDYGGMTDKNDSEYNTVPDKEQSASQWHNNSIFADDMKGR